MTQTPNQKRAATIAIWQSRKRRYNPCVRWVTMVIDWELKMLSRRWSVRQADRHKIDWLQCISNASCSLPFISPQLADRCNLLNL